MIISSIAAQSLRAQFSSLLAWAVLGLTQLLLAYLFLSQIDTYMISLQPKLVDVQNAPGVTELIVAPLYGNAAVIMLLTLPLLTMNLISGERRDNTFILLLTAPISTIEIVLGKYLAVLTYVVLIVSLVTLMPLALFAGTDLDTGRLIACFLALSLLLAAFGAIGLYFSCVFQHPQVAGLFTFALLLLLWIVNWATPNSDTPDNILEYLSILVHFNNMKTGLIDSLDIVYFILIILVCLILSIRHLGNERLQQ